MVKKHTQKGASSSYTWTENQEKKAAHKSYAQTENQEKKIIMVRQLVHVFLFFFCFYVKKSGQCCSTSTDLLSLLKVSPGGTGLSGL